MFLQKLFSGKKAPNAYDAIRDECMPLTGFFRGYCRLTTTFAWRSLTTGGTIIFPLVFVSKMYGTPLLRAIKYVTDKKHIVCNRTSLCVVGVVLLVRTCIACTRLQTMSICPNLYNATLEASGTQLLAMLLCGFVWGSYRYRYYLLLVLVMRPLATSISHVCTCTYRNSINICTTMIPTAVLWELFYSKYFLFGTKYDANLEIMSC